MEQITGIVFHRDLPQNTRVLPTDPEELPYQRQDAAGLMEWCAGNLEEVRWKTK